MFVDLFQSNEKDFVSKKIKLTRTIQSLSSGFPGEKIPALYYNTVIRLFTVTIPWQNFFKRYLLLIAIKRSVTVAVFRRRWQIVFHRFKGHLKRFENSLQDEKRFVMVFYKLIKGKRDKEFIKMTINNHDNEFLFKFS